MNILNELPKFPGFTYWWQWYSDWADVGAFNYLDHRYLIQVSRSRVGKARFRTVPFGKDRGTNKLDSGAIK